MRRFVAASVVLLVLVVSASAQMGGGKAGETKPGMMGSGMMPGGMMPGGMMGGCMMDPDMMMGQMMDPMMPANTKGCLGMAAGMMRGNLNMPHLQKTLGLSAEQAGKLKALQRPLQKEAIQTGAAIRVIELDVADLLAADKVDLGKVEAKLKEVEALRTKLILAHLKSSEEVKVILSKEQLEKFQGMCQSSEPSGQSVPATAAPQQGGQPPDEHHPTQVK